MASFLLRLFKVLLPDIFTVPTLISISTYASHISFLWALCLKVAIPVLIIGGFTSSLAAFGFAKMRFRGKNALFLALLATIMIPFAVVMIPQYVMFTKLGWTNTLLPLIIPGCFGNVSIIFFLRQNLIGIPDDLMEAAKLDGCGYFRTFLQIPINHNISCVARAPFINGIKI